MSSVDFPDSERPTTASCWPGASATSQPRRTPTGRPSGPRKVLRRPTARSTGARSGLRAPEDRLGRRHPEDPGSLVARTPLPLAGLRGPEGRQAPRRRASRRVGTPVRRGTLVQLLDAQRRVHVGLRSSDDTRQTHRCRGAVISKRENSVGREVEDSLAVVGRRASIQGFRGRPPFWTRLRVPSAPRWAPGQERDLQFDFWTRTGEFTGPPWPCRRSVQAFSMT
jgi:hypothetical protein